MTLALSIIPSRSPPKPRFLPPYDMSSAKGIAVGIPNYNSTSSRLRAVVCTEKTRNTLRTDPAGPFSAIFIRTSLYSLPV